MKSFSIAVCDDEEAMLLSVGSLVKEVFGAQGVEYTIEYYGDSARLAQAYKKTAYDLILLDIEMPGADGISFGKALRKYEEENGMGHTADIIYISSHEEKVFDTFMVKPFAFIRKSKILSDGTRILKLYIDSFSEPEDLIEFKAGADYFKLAAGDIIYVENRGHDQLLHVQGGREMPRLKTTLDKIEKQLVPHGFIRVHASYIVNWHFMKKIRGDEITLTTGEVIPISRTRKQDVMSEWMRLNRESGSTHLE